MSGAPRTAALAVPRRFFSPDEVPRASVPVPQIGGALDTADAALVDALQELAAQLGRNEEAFEKLSQQMEGSDNEVDTGELDTPANRRQAKRRYRTTSRKQPDLRTFDLLAGLAVRYGLERYLDEMIEAVQASPQHCRACLIDRVEKWRTDEGSWRRRWADRAHFTKWRHPIMSGRSQRARVRVAQLPTAK